VTQFDRVDAPCNAGDEPYVGGDFAEEMADYAKPK
jgi:hypothetical protein